MSLASLTHIPASRRSSTAALQPQRHLEESRKVRGIELTTDELARPPALGSKKKKRRKHNITANLSGTRYEVGESGAAAAAATMPVNSQAEFCLGAPVNALKLRERTFEVYTLITCGPDLGFLCDTAVKIIEHLVFFVCDFVVVVYTRKSDLVHCWQRWSLLSFVEGRLNQHIRLTLVREWRFIRMIYYRY